MQELEAAEKAVRKSGVVYISRVPPFMKPQTLKHFLEPHARKGLGRIFLTPEDHSAHAKRVKSGGNKKKSKMQAKVEMTRMAMSKCHNRTRRTPTRVMRAKKRNMPPWDMMNYRNARYRLRKLH